MTSSKTLFWFCISFILGIALQSFTKIPHTLLWGILICGFALIVASFLVKKEAAMIGFCLLFLVLGITRLQISEFTIANDAIAKLHDKPEKITLQGKIIDEPDVRAAYQKLKVAVGRSLVLVTLGRYPEYHYLGTITLIGKLKTPPEFDGFSYKDYLKKDGIYSVMDYPAIELVSTKHQYTILTYAYEKILFVKKALLQSLDANFLPPHSDLIKGVVFGNDKNMAKEIKDQFNITGLSHITAVSGTNIIILINILMVVLLALGFWRGQAFYGAVALIWLYIVMIGLPVSGVRAAIMGSVVLLAEKLGRQNTSSRLIVLTGALMLVQNPLLLFYDVGFQLSFLASLGIIYIKPLIDYGFTRLFLDRKQIGGQPKTISKSLKFFLDILSVTLAAQIVTMPVIVYNFGRLSLVAPITNILVLPVVEVLTILGIIVAAIGVFSTALGFIVSLPCLFLMSYILKVVEIFSKPWAALAVNNVPWVLLAGYYILLFALIKFFQRRQKPMFLGY